METTMTMGEFKAALAELLGEQPKKADLYIARLREAGLIEASGRGRTAKDVTFLDGLNIAVALAAANGPAQAADVVRAVRSAPLTHSNWDDGPARLGAADSSFASIMRALAEIVPTDEAMWEAYKDRPLGITFHEGGTKANIDLRKRTHPDSSTSESDIGLTYETGLAEPPGITRIALLDWRLPRLLARVIEAESGND